MLNLYTSDISAALSYSTKYIMRTHRAHLEMLSVGPDGLPGTMAMTGPPTGLASPLEAKEAHTADVQNSGDGGPDLTTVRCFSRSKFLAAN